MVNIDMENLLLSAALGLLLGSAVTVLSIKFFPALGWLDFPERYGLKRARLPYPGGIALWALILLGVGISDVFKPLLMPLVFLGLISWWDDRKNLSAWFRLLVHVWLVLFVVIQGVQIYFVSNPFADTNYPIASMFPHIAVILTIVWVVAIQNAMNWFDGLPGLNVGISGVGFFTLGILGIVRPELWFDPGHMPLTLLNLYLAGLCAGAFWFYLKGRIILGDTGSQVLGWLLAVMAIFSGAKIATTLIVLSLPLLDMAWVIFRRLILEKKSPFKGDLFHLHHLLAKKNNSTTVTLSLVGFSLLLGLSAVLLPADFKLPGFAVIAVAVLLVNWRLWSKEAR